MTSIITGDIVNSRKVKNPEVWMQPLKQFFNTLGSSPKIWEIYRGDSFQLEVQSENALSVALQIKAIVKSVKELDVRIAIGMGNKSYDAKSVSESTGEAHLFSGESFEYLKNEKKTLVFKSRWPHFDEELNLMLKLALVIIDDWSTTSATTVRLVLQQPAITQKELAKKLKISQSSVSARYNRAHLYEILELLDYYQKRIYQLTENA